MADNPIHPELRRIARVLPRSAVSPRLLKPLRLGTDIMAKRPSKDVTVQPLGSVSARLFQPPSVQHESVPGLVWVHGGGFVMGRATIDDDLCRHFAKTLGLVVASVDYRLAPEHPFPTPLDDCYDVLTWLANQTNVDANRIAVGGASAGGGLAAGLALMAAERKEIAPVFQLLSYPMLDDRTATRRDIDERNFRLWNNTSNSFGWESYTGLAPGSDKVSGLAAPARYLDLGALPPAWIGVGTLDLFYDEDVAYAARLEAAGIDCELEVVRGAFHGFDSVQPKARVTRAFRASQVAALAKALF